MSGTATLTSHTSTGKPVYVFDPPYQGHVPMAIVSTVDDLDGVETAIFPTADGENLDWGVIMDFDLVYHAAPTDDVEAYLLGLGYEVVA